MSSTNVTYSLEYCHVTPELNWETAIASTNNNAARLLRAYHDVPIQKCIMIDDLHAKIEITQKFIDILVEKLTVKPDSIYLESSFILPASKIANSINYEVAVFRDEKERLWLKKVKDNYGSMNEFMYR